MSVRGRRRTAVVAAALLSIPWWSVPARAYSVPYTDPYANGYIGFCDQQGNPIDHGTISDEPFVWSAVSSSPTPREFNYPGKTATLYAYQPRQGEDPGNWSGDQITAASYYTNQAHPMVEASSGAESIKQFMASYPAALDGLIEIRMYLGAPGNGIHTDTYPATDIRVQGATWTVVRGGTESCTAGYAISAMDGDPPSSTATASPAAPGGHVTAANGGASSPGAGNTGRGSGATGITPTAPGRAPSAPVATGSPEAAAVGKNGGAANESNSPGSSGPILAAVIALVALAGAGVLMVRTRRFRAGNSEPEDP